MAAVAVEFDYAKDLDSAATPVLTLAISPKNGSNLDLSKLRQLAENQIKEAFLRILGVGDVEVFGEYQPEIDVHIEPVKLRQFGVTLSNVILAISQQNLNIPNGLILRSKDQIRLKTFGEKADVSQLGSIVVKTRDGAPVPLKDIASIRVGYKDRQSLFIGNGKEAIGVNILRPEKTGHVTVTIAALVLVWRGKAHQY